MAKKRGNNEGTIVRRNDGRWMASIPSSHCQDGQGRERPTLPCCRYFPLHHPWGVLCDHQEPCSPLRSFICTPCLLHQPSGGACSPSGSSSAGKRLSNASSRASKRCSSVSLRVTCTVRPARLTWTLALAGASGRVETGSAWGCAWGCSAGGWLVPLLA